MLDTSHVNLGFNFLFALQVPGFTLHAALCLVWTDCLVLPLCGYSPVDQNATPKV